jgi:hypothetical protein
MARVRVPRISVWIVLSDSRARCLDSDNRWKVSLWKKKSVDTFVRQNTASWSRLIVIVCTWTATIHTRLHTCLFWKITWTCGCCRCSLCPPIEFRSWCVITLAWNDVTREGTEKTPGAGGALSASKRICGRTVNLLVQQTQTFSKKYMCVHFNRQTFYI